MATVAANVSLFDASVRRSREHAFFWGMSVLIAAVVFIGFARTYFLAGYFHARPVPAIVHVHAAVFTSWIALLVVQTSLAGTGRTTIHRRLGLIGFVLAPAVFILGVIVAGEMVRRFATVPNFDAPGVFAVALSEILGFALPTFFAFRLRRRPAVRKRLVLVGTIAMTTAGFGRWPVHALLHRPLPAMLAAFSLLLVLSAYDLLSTGRVHRATALGAAWVVCIEMMAIVVSHTAAWRSFAVYVQSLGG